MKNLNESGLADMMKRRLKMKSEWWVYYSDRFLLFPICFLNHLRRLPVSLRLDIAFPTTPSGESWQRENSPTPENIWITSERSQTTSGIIWIISGKNRIISGAVTKRIRFGTFKNMGGALACHISGSAVCVKPTECEWPEKVRAAAAPHCARPAWKTGRKPRERLKPSCYSP